MRHNHKLAAKTGGGANTLKHGQVTKIMDKLNAALAKRGVQKNDGKWLSRSAQRALAILG